MKAIRSKGSHRCPKTEKVAGVRLRSGWQVALYPLVGLASLVWFLLRVVPKPSRARYPCQRVAAPLAFSFVLWLLGVSGSALAFRKAAARFRKARAVTALLFVVAGVAGIAWAVSSVDRPAHAAYPPHTPNQPIGVARGLHPGRVVWVYEPTVTDWAGPGSGERWYEHVDQAVANQVVSQALRTYAGVDTDLAAWISAFQHFSGGAGYTPGEKVVIKINLTTANARMALADGQYNQVESGAVTLDSIANAPQLLHALLDQLVNVVGVAQSDITVGDPTGLFVNYLYDPLHADFPDVRYWDNRGTLGRTRAEFGTVPLHWSTSEATGTTQDYLPVAFEEATYLINFAVLKSHDGSGITVNAKNHYGSLLRCPDGYLRDAPNTWPPPYNGYYHMHDTLPGEGFRAGPDVATMGQYRALVDLMGHEAIGGKTLLYLVDGLFGGQVWYSTPSKWSMPPYNGDWPSSLFLSMDPVAIESVARDFLSQQWPEHALMCEGVEDYLHEAALANAPPSGTVYDPENDGTRLASLGTHEHWNNANDKQYSRNLGAGDGIELLSPSIPAEHDLVMTKRVEPTMPVSPGASITYTVAYSNVDRALASGVVITDRLPGELIQVGYDSSHPITPIGGVPYAWMVGDLSPTQGGVITITGVVTTGLPAGYVFTNTGIIRATPVGSDTTGNSDSVAVTIANVPPVAVGDRYTTPVDMPLVVAAPGMLANDLDLNGDPLVARLVRGPVSGTLAFDPDGSYTYTPTLIYEGGATFSYRAHDGTADSNVATVMLVVGTPTLRSICLPLIIQQ
jgi:uncharacterized repeat protein (TIGR01451 family)